MSQTETLTLLRSLRLSGFADTLEEQWNQPHTYESLGFDERLAILVSHEVTYRDNKRMQRLLRSAKLKEPAQLKEIDYTHSRGIKKSEIANLQTNDWVKKKRNIIITGSTGCGKTYIACALGNNACIGGHSVKYVRATRLMKTLTLSHGDGSYLKLISQIAKVNVLIIDDWGLEPLTQSNRNDLLEIMDDRHGSSSTIIGSQIPIAKWHDYIGEPTLADAILDRLVHNAHSLKLSGESMRRAKKI